MMILFYVFGAIAVTTSLLVIAQRSPIYSVLLLIASFGALSGLYVLLGAPFVAVIQIVVYAGAIMVLFLFVVMLLNAPREDTEEDLAQGTEASQDGTPASASRHAPASGAKSFGVMLAGLFVIEVVWALAGGGVESGELDGGGVTSVGAIGRLLFTDYAFAFEVTSVLILVAMVGAVVLARRESVPVGKAGSGGEALPSAPRE
jgi:NADH-quinone oxidoreductase subunit J